MAALQVEEEVLVVDDGDLDVLGAQLHDLVFGVWAGRTKMHTNLFPSFFPFFVNAKLAHVDHTTAWPVDIEKEEEKKQSMLAYYIIETLI